MKLLTRFSYITTMLLTLLLVSLSSCIENNIPFPRIKPVFKSMEAEGQMQGAQIDSVQNIVTLYFPEEVDIKNVKILDYTISPEGAIITSPKSITDGIDLSKPLNVTLSLYQHYDWTIRAVQNIERYFTVSGQIGSTFIDVPGRRIVASVSDKADLSHLEVTSIKLGPKGSYMTPDLQGQYVDFRTPVEVDVTAYGETSTWTIFIETTQSTVNTERVDAWTSVAWVYGKAQEGRNNGVQYRLKGDKEWLTVPSEWLTVDGGSFYARLIHLDPLTTYEARAFSDDEYAQTIVFTTEGTAQMPNSNFDQWWLNGKIWNPWPEGGTQYWDTGNKGATTLGPSNSVPTDETVSGSGWAAKLETKFVGIGALGKLAAGNIFVGSYVRTDGTNGVLSFGREFKLHPTKLKGYLKYKSAPISSTTAGFHELKGQPDTCIIWVALIDSPEPFEIRTNPNNRHLFDPDADYVVAYGKISYGEDVNQYTPFEFDLVYRDTSRKPRYILCTASASKYGDYFTGGNGSVLYVDDLELLYDY